MFGLILLEPDFGTAVSLLLIIGVMVFAAGLNYRYLVGAALVALPALYIVLMSADYRRRRLLAFWNPEADPLGDGFQIMQSLIAVGTGDVFGRGLMGGRAEAVLPARAAHRLHLRGDRRGAGPHRRDGGAGLLLRHRLARRCASRCAPKTRSGRLSRSA